MTDGINFNFASPDFMTGRVVGTIDARTADEPHQFVIGRQLIAASAATWVNFFSPLGGINHCVALVDSIAGRVHLDLGNACRPRVPAVTPSTWATCNCRSRPSAARPSRSVSFLLRRTFGWYERTAGVVTCPLTATQLVASTAGRLVVTSEVHSDAVPVWIAEHPNGFYARPDQMVHRMSPGEVANIDVHVSRFGVSPTGSEARGPL